MNEIQQALLVALWHVRAERGRAGMDWREWAQDNGKEILDVDRAYEELAESGLIERSTIGPCAEITPHGILVCEESGFIDEESLRPHIRFRSDLLVALSKARAEHGPNSTSEWRELVRAIGADEKLFIANENFLSESGHMKWITHSLIMITAKGEFWVQGYLSKLGLVERLEELKSNPKMSPQQRGHELEKLLEQAAFNEEWKVERNARAPGEENDLIVSQGFAYFIVSCKWLASACEVEDARNLRDRVTHRPGTRGILFSMSGFTKGFIEDITQRMSDAILIVFGPEDIGKALAGEFTSLLESKFHSAIANRAFTWS